MDSYNIIIYGSDNRQRALASNLPGRKIKVQHQEISPPKADIIILPTPLSKLGQPESASLPANLPTALAQHLEADAPLTFAGAVTRQWANYFAQHQIPYIDMMKDEAVAQKNAQVTAEATLAELILSCDYSIADEKYLITGYGRCARALARKMQRLNAKVTVLARSPEARKQARKDGCTAVTFAYGPKEAYGTRAIINTVPAPVIGKEIIKELQQDCVIIDIASTTGLSEAAMQLAEEKGIHYRKEPGLPGRYQTRTSGKILADCVLSNLHSQQKNIEGMPWIYQILE